MRVIAGSARGTKLLCPEGLAVRPTHDRVKEALFSMLNGRLSGAFVLDLFAGTGSLGIEALSRGAAGAVFVDASVDSLKAAENNLIKTHLTDRAKLIKSDYLAFLQSTSDFYDIIFLDPPYQGDFLARSLEVIAERNLLSPDGIIYCETEGEPPVQTEKLFHIVRDKRYGRARVLLLEA